MDSTTIRLLDDLQSAETDAEIFSLFHKYIARYSFDIASYHHIRRENFVLPLEKGLINHTFPKAWVDTYETGGFYVDDPIIGSTLRAGAPTEWADIFDHIDLTSHQREFASRLNDYQFKSGIGVPVSSHSGLISYFGLASSQADFTLTGIEERLLQLVCQEFDRAYMRLHPYPHVGEMLTDREREVMHWVALGKSNGDIASILEISEATVDTYLRRVFSKLGVNNRTTAAIKSIGSGALTVPDPSA
ncbi:MAG: LuxR family transcriptional regulator [Devosiaceae bacterium]|nr:LuxR family transcriptional regulator [Devosiaceae bacterium MH13]